MNIRNASVYAAVVAAGCVLVLASFYPGYMSADSLDQLGQARQGMLNDHHSPVMTMLWAFLDRLWPGPQGIVLFHNVCFWSGTAILCGLAFRRMTFAILATFSMGLAPPIFALLGTAWKDVGFGCSLLLAVALLALAERTGRPRWILASVPLLFYAISVRHDGIVGVFPVCLWAGTLFARANLRARFPGWYRTGAGAIAGTALFGTLVLADLAVNRVVVRANRAYPEQVGLVYDLAYLSLLDGHWLLPEGTVEPRRVDRRFAELRSTFDRYDCWSKYCFVMLEFFPGTDDPDRIAQLRRQWRKEILRHLKSYLQMKVKLARIDYSFGTGEVLYAFHPGVDPNSLGVTLRATALNTSVMSFLNAIRNSVLFQAWVYLAALLAVLAGVLITNPRRHLDVLFVGLGALAKDLVYLVWWPSYDFRYHFWTVICVLAIPLMLLARNRDSRRAASPEEPVPDGTRDCSD